MVSRTLLIAFLILSVSAALAGEKAVCAVCGPREGAGFEPVEATATYRGKQYFFCSLKCKVEFLKDPEQFLTTEEGTAVVAFTLNALDGGKVSLADFDGQVVLLDFWATFCRPCIDALPSLQSLHEKYRERGFSVVGLSVDERAELVRKAVTQGGVRYPILASTAAVWNAYKVNSLPTLILIGRDGRIVRRFGGEADHQLMIAQIERALASP